MVRPIVPCGSGSMGIIMLGSDGSIGTGMLPESGPPHAPNSSAVVDKTRTRWCRDRVFLKLDSCVVRRAMVASVTGRIPSFSTGSQDGELGARALNQSVVSEELAQKYA